MFEPSQPPGPPHGRPTPRIHATLAPEPALPPRPHQDSETSASRCGDHHAWRCRDLPRHRRVERGCGLHRALRAQDQCPGQHARRFPVVERRHNSHHLDRGVAANGASERAPPRGAPSRRPAMVKVPHPGRARNDPAATFETSPTGDHFGRPRVHPPSGWSRPTSTCPRTHGTCLLLRRSRTRSTPRPGPGRTVHR